ncbi:MAG: YihY/virulence factor BrkB family protein, partial [Deltaproteobacteria bacterium]
EVVDKQEGEGREETSRAKETPPGERIAAVLRYARRSVSRFIEGNGFVYSSAISFNVFLSIIPFLFIVSMVGGFFSRSLSNPNGWQTLLQDFFPFAADVIIENFFLLQKKTGTLGIFGFVALFLTTLSFTNTVHLSLSVLWGERKRKGFLSIFLSHFLIIIGSGVVIIAITIIASLTALLRKAGIPLETPALRFLVDESLRIFNHLIPFIVISLASAFAYRHLSPIHVPIPHSLSGGFVFGVLTYLVKEGFILYLRFLSRLNVIYGSIFGIVCFIIASYLFAVFFLMTACFIYEALPEKTEKAEEESDDSLAGG